MVDLPGTGHAGDAAQQAKRDVEVDAAQVVDACAEQLEVLAAGLAAQFGDGES